MSRDMRAFWLFASLNSILIRSGMLLASSSMMPTRPFSAVISCSSVATLCSRSATSVSVADCQADQSDGTKVVQTTRLVQLYRALRIRSTIQVLLCRLLVCGLIAVDPCLDLTAEVADQPLHRPGGRISQRAD